MDGWAPQEEVGLDVKPLRMLLHADGGAKWWGLLGSMQAGMKGKAVRQYLLWAGIRVRGQLLSISILLRIL
jgi:hypothetical protein